MKLVEENRLPVWSMPFGFHVGQPFDLSDSSLPRGLVTALAFDGSPDIHLVTKGAVALADLGHPDGDRTDTRGRWSEEKGFVQDLVTKSRVCTFYEETHKHGRWVFDGICVYSIYIYSV